jgi:hypothetical protein
MPLPLTLTCDDPDTILNAGEYAAGALMRLQWSATSTQPGTFADISGTGSTPTVNIVSGQFSYPAYDPNGTASLWYRTRFENSGGTRLSGWTASFQVGDTNGAYASPAQFRRFIRNQTGASTDTDGDIELLALQAAARAIDRECGRVFRIAGAATARTYTAGLSTATVGWPFFYRRYAVDVDDFFDATSITVKFDDTGNGGYGTTSTAFRPGPTNAPQFGMPYRSLLFDIGTYPPQHTEGIQITLPWGWNVVPSSVVNANLIQAARFVKRRDSPFGIAGSPDMGNELRLLAKLDPDVALLLRAYKLDWGYA